MKRTALTLVLIVVLVVVPLFGVTKANPLPPVWRHPEMTVTIHSPQNGTYAAQPVLVNFSAQLNNAFDRLHEWRGAVSGFFYVLDGQNMSISGVKIEETNLTGVNATSHYAYNYSGQANLTDLTVGSHNVTVYYGVFYENSGFIVYNASWSATHQFYVKNATSSPAPTSYPEPTPVTEPFPTTLVATASGVSMTVVGASLLFYFKKHKH
jgi:hypothetical protein